MSIDIKEEIPAGSRWTLSGDSERTVVSADPALVRFKYRNDVNETWTSDTFWWLANMRRIDVPEVPMLGIDYGKQDRAAIVISQMRDGKMRVVAEKEMAPAARIPKVGETWRYDLGPEVVITGFDATTKKMECAWADDGERAGLHWNKGECWTHVADAPAPKVEVCGFPGCEGDLDVTLRRSVHRGCVAEGFDGCYCNGLTKQQTRCHDFIPAVSKTETPAAPVFAGDKQREHFDSICKVCFRSGPNPVCGHAIHHKVVPPVLKHDFSDRYCADRAGLLCVACGWPQLQYTNECKPRPGWRGRYETGLTSKQERGVSVSPPLPRHFAQPPLSHGLQMGGGAVRCACSRCRP